MNALKLAGLAGWILLLGGAANAAPGDKDLPPGAIARLGALGIPQEKPAPMIVAVAPDGKQVATGGGTGVIHLWDRATGKELHALRGHQREILALAYSPDGTRLLSASAYEPARLWDVIQGKESRAYSGSTEGVSGFCNLSYSPDGKKVALTTFAPTVQLMDMATEKIEWTMDPGHIDRVAFSPDGRWVAGGGFNHKTTVWEAATGKEVWSADNGSSTAAIAFSSDSQVVAAGTYGNQIFIRNAAKGTQVRQLQGPGGTVRTLAISPDGRLLAAAGDTPVVAVYEVATQELVQKLTGHTGNVWSLAFAPNGRSLVSGSFDGTALVWDMTGQEQAKKQGGALTAAELDESWAALNGDKAEAAHQAILALANAPKQTVALLRMQLTEYARPDVKVIAKWVADLDDDRFEVRETASRELARLGQGIVDELRKARDTTRSAEVRKRLNDVLESLHVPKQGDERLRSQRIVAVLELGATTEAKALLEHLAQKASPEEMRLLARAALERLAKRL